MLSISSPSVPARSPFTNRFKIGVRVLAGFLAVLLLMAILAVVSVTGFRSAIEGFTTFDRIAHNAMRVGTIDRTIVALRRDAYAFAASGDATAAKNFRDTLPGLRKDIAETIAAVPHPERKAKLTEAARLVDGYAADFEKVAALRLDRDKQVNERLNVLGLQGRESLSQIVAAAMADGDFEAAALAGQAQEALMQVRLTTNRYLANGDPRLVDSFRQWSAGYAKAGAALYERLQNPQRKQLAQTANQRMQAYTEAFEIVAKETAEMNAVMNGGMRQQALGAGRLLEEVRVSMDKAMTELGHATEAELHLELIEVLTVTGIAMVLGLLIAFVIGRDISGSLQRMAGAMGRLASGDKDVVIPGVGYGDEIGAMATSVQVFKDNMIETDRLRAEQEDAKKRAEIEKKAAMNRMADEFEASVKGIVQTVSSASTELQSTAQTMSSTAAQTSQRATAVAAASEQASSNVQTVASAAEELSGSITEISRQVAESAKIAGRAVEDAGRTNTQVQALADAAQKIGDVVKLINDIAGQTNLLALNATIEAARAGEAGKGFAVVASEVKSLATQTAKATDDIASQVKSIQSVTADSVRSIGEITATIGRINEIATTIASAVEEQGAATQEIARNVQQASAGTAEVSSNIGGVTQAATDAGAAASQVLSSSGELSKQSETLRLKVDAFSATIRAA